MVHGSAFRDDVLIWAAYRPPQCTKHRGDTRQNVARLRSYLLLSPAGYHPLRKEIQRAALEWKNTKLSPYEPLVLRRHSLREVVAVFAWVRYLLPWRPSGYTGSGSTSKHSARPINDWCSCQEAWKEMKNQLHSIRFAKLNILASPP